MARQDFASFECAQFAAVPTAAETFIEMGMRFASGRDGVIDLIEAHKWFNIAAARGDREAVAMRAEVAAEMNSADVAAAQKAARAWLQVH